MGISFISNACKTGIQQILELGILEALVPISKSSVHNVQTTYFRILDCDDIIYIFEMPIVNLIIHNF